MSLEEELAAWVAGRPDWQKDAVARFCRNETLTPDDISSAADQLIAGTYPTVEAITAADVPGNSAMGESIRLVAISDIVGVNALIGGQRLTFGRSGLTIVYGDNASGKSGYARLIREAVTARVKAELLGNVFAQRAADQRANVEYMVSDELRSWTLSDAPALALSSVRFYDEECGDAYVTAASEISYRPSALTLLDRLSSACDAIQQELIARLAANQQERPDLPLLPEGTEAARFLRGLTDKTTLEQIENATTLRDDHGQALADKLAEEARLRGSDPTKERARFARMADDWETVDSHVSRLSTALDAAGLDALEKQRNHARELREAARIASTRDFAAEPLTGAGSATWRALWEAARAYSEAETYHEHEFPMVGDGARCVLCQQPLQPAAADRMRRFQAFMTDTTERDAAAAENALTASRATVAQLMTLPATVTSALSQLQGHGEQIATVETWLGNTALVAAGVVAWLDDTATALPSPASESPSDSIRTRANELRQARDAIDASSFAGSLEAVAADVRELQAAGALAEANDQLVAEVERLVSKTRIQRAKQQTDTTGITRKATDLTKVHVTSLIRDQFTRETERLQLRRVTIDPTAGRRLVTLEHKPKLLGATFEAQIDDVLSEGEQTALGLAGFLTEIEFDESKSAVVLDDPVTSLDAGRRSRVAKRLVELAQDRQVVVFTHEATLVTALNKAARDAGVPVTERAIIRDGQSPGKAIDQHPWSVRDTKQRIHDLEADLARLKKERDQLDADAYTDRVQMWAGRLSQTWERAVNLEVINEVVDRGTNEVRPRKFRILAQVTEQDNTDLQAGYEKVSEWAPRHDQAPEVNFVPPEPDEMELELARLKEWATRVSKYRNS